MFVSATPARDERNVLNGFYFFSDLSVKIKVHKGMFTGPRQVMRLRFETALVSEKIVRVDVNSYIGKKKIDIHSKMMCQPPDQLEVDLPVLQN